MRLRLCKESISLEFIIGRPHTRTCGSNSKMGVQISISSVKGWQLLHSRIQLPFCVRNCSNQLYTYKNWQQNVIKRENLSATKRKFLEQNQSISPNLGSHSSIHNSPFWASAFFFCFNVFRLKTARTSAAASIAVASASLCPLTSYDVTHKANLQLKQLHHGW